MTYKNPQYHQVDNLQLNRLNELCDSFDDRLHSGDCPKIEELLERVPADEQAAAFVELLAIDLEFCCSSGFRPELADYHTRFPNYRSQIEDGFRLIAKDASQSDDASQQKSDTSAYAMPERVGDFRIIREVGRGGMGVVYEAQQESLDRSVAIKVLARNVITDGRQRERFDREARAAGRLHHSNIVPVFGVGCDDGVDFLVMQLIRGKPLDAVISRLRELRAAKPSRKTDRGVSLQDVFGVPEDHQHSPVSSERAAGAAKPVGAETASFRSSDTFQIDRTHEDESAGQSVRSMQYWRELAEVIRAAADALQYAHEQGILHRDIKPGNLLLDTKGRIWITDFGLAKAENSEDLTQTGQLLGTVKYMPPEAFNGQSSHLGDIYALGLTLYELAALRPAFQAEDQNQMIRLVMHEAPASVRSINPAIPRDLETIVNKAIERDPKNRYTTSADLAEDLRRFCHDEPILARRVSVFEHLARWAVRHKLVATLSCCLAAVLLLGTTWLSVYANRLRGLNTDLGKNEVKLTEARNAESKRAEENEKLAKEAKSNLVGLNIASAFGHVKDGSYHRALVGMQTAWDSDSLDSRDDRCHQMRIGAILNQYPKLVGLVIPDGKRRRPQYQPWNDLLLVSGFGVAEIWQPSTGELKWQVNYDSDATAQLCSDGQLLATKSDCDILIWDIRSGKVVQTLHHNEIVRQNVFSPDGKTVATASADGFIHFWQTATGTLLNLQIDSEDTTPQYLNFIDNDRIIASNGADKVRIWSSTDGRPLTKPLIHKPPLDRPPTVSADHRRMATVDGKNWTLWDLEQDSRLADFSRSSIIETVHLSADGRDALVNSSKTTATWHYDFHNSITDPDIYSLYNPRQSNNVDISPDGKIAAARSTGGTTFVWDLQSHKKILELANVSRLSFADYRTLIATGTTSVTRILQFRHRHHPLTARHVGYEHRHLYNWIKRSDGTARSKDGDRKFLLGETRGRLYDRDDNEIPLAEPVGDKAGPFGATFSPDGKRLLTIEVDGYRVWDSSTGMQIGETLSIADKSEIHRSMDGRIVSFRSSSDDVAIWDLNSNRYLVDARPDLSNSATSSNAGPSNLELFSNVSSCAIAPNGSYLILTHHGSELYLVIDIDTLQEKYRIDRHHGVPTTVRFTSDSKYFITSNSDTTVRIWDAETGEQFGPHLPHPVFARDAALSDDGRFAATRDSRNDIRTWDVQTGEQLGLPINASKFDSGLMTFSDDLEQLVADPYTGHPWLHQLPRVSLNQQSCRLLVQLVAHLYDCGLGRTQPLTRLHIDSNPNYITAWQEWKRSIASSVGDVEPGTTIDLLPLVAGAANPVFGTWECDGEVLTSDESRFARIELPVAPSGSYRLSLNFCRQSGTDHIGLHLPTCNGRTLFLVDSHPETGIVTLEGIDGNIRNDFEQELGQMAPLKQECHLEVSVVQDGSIATISAILDGKDIYRWSGESRRLALRSDLDVFHPEWPGIQTHNSRFEFREVRYTKLAASPL